MNPTTDPAMEEALARLHRSRLRLRQALTTVAPPAGEPRAPWFMPSGLTRAWLRSTAWGGLLDPLLGAAGGALQAWWERQTWHESVALARHTVSAQLSPRVRSHPIAAVLLTAALGAVVAGSGVWRWTAVRRSALYLAAHLRRATVAQLSSPAVQGVVLGAVLSWLAARQRRDSGDKAPAVDPAAAQGACAATSA